MIAAEYSDKERIVNILSASFNDNKSVNYIIRQGNRRGKRIRRLMEYSFNVCYYYGKVFLSNDKSGCALVVLPDKKKTTLRTIFFDLKLIFTCLGIRNARNAMSRESKIKKLQPKDLMYYLWFIGVDPEKQNHGIGSTLLKEVIAASQLDERNICLETSTVKNLPWYQKFGFAIYNDLDLGNKLFFLKRDKE